MPLALHSSFEMTLLSSRSWRVLSMVTIGLVLVAGSISTATPAQASTVTIDGITFQVDSENVAAGAVVTGYSLYAQWTTPVIPPVVNDGLVDYVVTGIGDYAFVSKRLTSVAIPDSVVSIGDYAFLNNKLTSVVIPDSVTSLGEGAFTENDLTSVVIPNSITSMANYVFNQNDLASVVIPESVTSIGIAAFSSNKLASAIIPNSVTSIGTNAFSHNKLKSVVLPNSITDISDDAFQFNSLTLVEIPDTVAHIGTGAFYHNKLTSVVIPDSVISIGGHAFYLNELTSIVIPESLTSIANYAFAGNKLTSVTIPDSVISIGNDAFAHNDLSSVAIADSVISIGNHAFAYNHLSSVIIPNSVTSIGSAAFADNRDSFYYSDGVAIPANPLASVVFLGPPPSTFTGAGPNGSLGDGIGLTVSYPAGFDSSTYPGGYTSPLWEGYAAGASFETDTPMIVGTVRVGETLTATNPEWTPRPATITYEWYRNGVVILDASAASYTVAASDLGAKLSIKVTGAKNGYVTTHAVSEETVPVATGVMTPVYRFWSDAYQGHFYTASASERDHIIKTYPSHIWKYEQVAYQAFTTQQPGTVPLYRFWSGTMNGHFYTASASERDHVIRAYDDAVWAYEHVAYYVYPSGSTVAGTDEVYRFWSDAKFHHFYTASAAEKNHVIHTYAPSVWSYEHVAFRVPGASRK